MKTFQEKDFFLLSYELNFFEKMLKAMHLLQNMKN